MTESWTLNSAIPTHAECCRVRERAQRILAEAQKLRDRLDQTGGLLSFALQPRETMDELIPLTTGAGPHLQAALFAA